jgi:hypothetical protein
VSLLRISTGASLPWRYAIGVTTIIPIVCFSILLFSPDSPSWLISKGREEDAKESLKKLRGSNHPEICEAELFRINNNLRMLKKQEEDGSSNLQLKELLTDSKFLKPFGILLFVFCVGLKWTGLVAIAFYIVPFLMYVKCLKIQKKHKVTKFK